MSKKIMAAIDFSEVTQRVLEQTVELAKALEASVTLLHVFSFMPDVVLDDTGMAPVDYDLEELLEKRSEEQLLAAKKQLNRVGVACETCVCNGSPSYEILNYIKEETPDLVLIGSHGHGALYHLVLGSVSEKVVDKAGCAVLIVK